MKLEEQVQSVEDQMATFIQDNATFQLGDTDAGRPKAYIKPEILKSFCHDLVSTTRKEAQAFLEDKYKEQISVAHHDYDELESEHLSTNNQLSDAVVEINSLKGQVATLISSLDNRSSSSSHHQSAPKLAFKPADPVKFSGAVADQATVEAFIAACNTAFLFDPRGSEIHKIAYAISHFQEGKDASEWIRPHLDSLYTNSPDREDWLQSWSLFSAELKDRFGNPLAKKDSWREWTSLRQGKDTARAYTTRFNTLLHQIELPPNSEVVLTQYQDNLRDNVRTRLVAKSFTVLRLLQSAAMEIDDDLGRIAASNPRSTPSKTQDKGENPASPTTPSKSSSTTLVPAKSPGQVSSGRRGPLTNEEKQYRFDNNLCMYCGGADHRFEGCAKKSKTFTPRPPPVGQLQITAAPTTTTTPAFPV